MKNKKYFLVIVIVALFCSGIKAQSSLPYYTGFDTPAEQAGWEQYILDVHGTYGPWTYLAGGVSAPYRLYHDYNNFGTVEDWFVSPALNFTTPASINLKIKVFVMLGAPIDPDYVGIWYSSSSPNPAARQYEEVANLTGLASSDDLWIDTTINLPFHPGSGYIGFKFMNGYNWFIASIDNIFINSLTTGISDNNNENGLLTYPNPAKADVRIESEESFSKIELFNMLGENVFSKNHSGETKATSFDCSALPRGTYFLKVYNRNRIIMNKLVLE